MSNDADESFLDDVLDRAVAMIQRGLAVDAEAIGAERPHLVERVRDQVRLAECTTPRPRADEPSIDGYTIVAEAGRGGMGVVYLARQERLGGRAVALKVLSGSSSLSPAARRRFKQESEAVARLRHAHIVAVHDVAPASGPPAYAMEWVEGRSLAAVIERARSGQHGSSVGAGANPMDVVRGFVAGQPDQEHARGPEGALAAETYTVFVCRVGVAIARALEAVHRAGLLHRDVKPSNILIRRDGVPLLTDFGLARDQDATLVTQAGQFLGTPAYAPPEQLRGEGEAVDPRSDVYSLGATLYHALALRVPFDGSTTGAILRQIESGRLAPLRAVDARLPRDLETIVGKAMEPEPSRRYETADELAEDLERVLSLRPIRARRAGLLRRGVLRVRRNRVALLGVVVGGTAGAGAAILLAVWLFVLPPLSDREVERARLALVGPEYSTWSVPKGGGRTDSVQVNTGAVAQALRHYQRARALGGRDPTIILEEQTLRLALALGESAAGPEIETSVGLKLATEYVARWRSGPPVFTEAELAKADALELRALGLIAMVCRDFQASVEAWSRLDPLAPDPLVEASLGELYLTSEQPALAYPHLVSASRGFPDQGWIVVSAADAAVRLGLLNQASVLLERASRMENLDGSDSLRRVRAMLSSSLGHDADAVRDFEVLRQSRRVPAARLAYANHLRERGRYLDSLQVISEAFTMNPSPKYFRHFAAALVDWCRTRSASERCRSLRLLLCGEAWHRHMAVLAVVQGYNVRAIDSTPAAARARPRRRSALDGTLPPPPAWDNLRLVPVARELLDSSTRR